MMLNNISGFNRQWEKNSLQCRNYPGIYKKKES